MQVTSEPDDGAWHLDKKVPIALIFAVAMQGILGAWYASKLDSRTAALESLVPIRTLELAKLEQAREDTNVAIRGLTDDVRSLLELARRNETRNVMKDSKSSPPEP